MVRFGMGLEIADQFVGTPYAGELPLVATSKALALRDFSAKQEVMSRLVQWFIDAKLVVSNPVTHKILAQLDTIRTVAGMAAVVGLSPRQLQRTLKHTTGFSPHDLLKVLRIMGVYGAGGALVKSNYARPGVGGTLVYFSVEDSAKEESRVAAAGGKVTRPKFSIGEFGWVTLCEDTEGNLFGFSSMK